MLNCIGIDISKANINVHISKNFQDFDFVNSVKGFKSLYSKLKKIYKKEIDKIIFIFEPTGSYSEALRKYCSQQKNQKFKRNIFLNVFKILLTVIQNIKMIMRISYP